jgi:hypothetical protein
MKKNIAQNLWWVSFIIAFILLVIHSFNVKSINVDSTSILLLIVMLISPFILAIKKIKYGDFEAEIDSQEVQKVKDNLERNIDSRRDDDEVRPEIYMATDAIRALAESDPAIALAKVRIELEKVLTRLARMTLIETEKLPLGTIVQKLSSHEIIAVQEGKSLREVISICNRAIHGEFISEDDAKTIVELGIELLENLYWDIQIQISTGTIISEEIIALDESHEYYDKKKYRLTTIIPLVENPKKVVRELTQEQLDEFLDGYNEYAEFIVELIPII